MGNKRVSQLNVLTYPDVAPDDLLLIADISVTESKRITTKDLQTYVLNNGNITASLNGTASWAMTALFALNAPQATSVLFASSSYSSSWASSSLFAISASHANNADRAITASYALTSNAATSSFALNAVNSDTASYLKYTGVFNGTASYAVSSSHADFVNFATSASQAAHSILADTASFALALLNNNVNMSGNQRAMTYGGNYLYNVNTTASLVTQSLFAQVDKVDVSSQFRDTDNVDITSRGLIAILHNAKSGVHHTDFNPTLRLMVQNLNTGVSQSIATASYAAYFASVVGTGSTIPTTTASAGAVQRFYLTGSANLSGSYRIYAEAAFNDYGDGDISFYFYNSNSVVMRLVSKANNFLIQTGSVPALKPNDDSVLFNYSASWNLFGAVTASSGQGQASDLVSNNSSSYITYLQPTNALDSIHGLWTLKKLKNINLDNSGVSYIDGIAPSVVTMSCVNCFLSSLQPFAGVPVSYSLGYLNATNNVISDISSLPVSMSYLNLSSNQGINSLPPAWPKGLRYLNVSNCDLLIDDLDEITSMLVSEVSSSNTIGGTLDITGNVGSISNTLTFYNVTTLTSSPYNWTVAF